MGAFAPQGRHAGRNLNREPTEREKILATTPPIEDPYLEYTENFKKTITPTTTNNPIKKRASELNRHFAEEEIRTPPPKRMKNCSTSSAIRDMQIKASLRFHPTPVRMAITENANNNKCWRGCGEVATVLHRWWESAHQCNRFGKQFAGSSEERE